MKRDPILNSEKRPDLPVWARDNAFPPAGDGYGWIDSRGRRHQCTGLEDLADVIRNDRKSAVLLIWTPESAHCRIPEEIKAFKSSITQVRRQWVADDLEESQQRLKWFGASLVILIAYLAFQGWKHAKSIELANGVSLTLNEELRWILGSLLRSTTVGIALLGFLVFAFIPWYQARKKSSELKARSKRAGPIVPLIRFEIWLDTQKAPVTWILLGLITMVALAQLVFTNSVHDVGLVKTAYRSGEFWRLFTAPMLHGGFLHYFMNAMALLYLGKRVEVFARWPHVPMVFLFSAIVAGEASVRFTDATSVGASGGLMGWLGFLLVFETLHSSLVPKSAKRRLIGGVVMTALIGLIGYRFIDNAAHFGGLIAGMGYAAIVFPKSASVARPKMNLVDKTVGALSMVFIMLCAAFTIYKMAGGFG
ncbi:rhomboid family intramembrane serine protease [Luteolibacter algae]|uniref:Rhomboid family intramembrane serine protease n=1 Tax=Luteolibacter algae TaxID=454151 RepID=A0ABW5DAB8_9BACT